MRKLALADVRVAVIGLGSVGRQVAVQLASSGVGHLVLVDPGLVSRRSQAAEGCHADDVGRPRAHAAAQAGHAISPGCDIETVTGRHVPTKLGVDAVFCCTAAARWRSIWRLAVRHGVHFFAAAAVRGDRLFVTVVADQAAALSSDVEPDLRPPWGTGRTGRACAAPAAAIAGGLLVAELGRFVRGERTSREIHVNLTNLTLAVTGIGSAVQK